MTRLFFQLVVPAALTLCVAPGCAVEATVEPPDEAVSSQASALASSAYDASNDSVQMWKTDLGFCYLTGVSGDLSPLHGTFAIANSAWIHVDDTGRWILETPGVSAQARCVPWTDFRGAGSGRFVSQPEGWFEASAWSHTPLWGKTSLCYLAGVSSGFNGGGEHASVSRGPVTWALDLRGGGSPPAGQAMCIDTGRSTVWKLSESAPGNTTFAWSQGRPWTWMTKTSDGICTLTGLSGKFAGAGESVEIGEVNGYWVLRGTSMQQGVAATAQCVPFSQAFIPSGGGIGGGIGGIR